MEERTDFPQYVMMDLAFRFGFIVQEGTDEQVVRYIQLGRRAEQQAATPQLAGLIREYMDRYEAELNDRKTSAGKRGYHQRSFPAAHQVCGANLLHHRFQ